MICSLGHETLRSLGLVLLLPPLLLLFLLLPSLLPLYQTLTALPGTRTGVLQAWRGADRQGRSATSPHESDKR